MSVGAALGLIRPRQTLIFGVGMVVLGVVGWADDRHSLKARLRLAVHLAVAAWTAYMLGGLPALRFGSDSIALGAIGYGIAVLGVVWSINLFNFMDGIDGLAASQAVLIFSAMAVLLSVKGDYSLATIAAILAASSGGFLAWNWPPAKIFLGDVGSAAIGYLIAAMALASENRGSVPLLAVVIIYGVFIVDASVTLIRRLVRGSRLAHAHRDHAYQRLTRAWGSHKRVTVSTAALTAVLAVVAAASTMNERLLLPSLLAMILLLGLLLLAVERRAPM
jgi:Fuc2NAc and GlcNAc transferase